MKQRVLYLDIIRIVACVMIIAMHAPIPNTGISSYVLSADSLLTIPGIGLFLMVSGALLLPVNMPTNIFLKKRLTKIVIPTLLWTLFYMFVYSLQNGFNGQEVLQKMMSVPFSAQYNGVLWFMYMLTGLYLIAPILSRWIGQANKRELEFYLLLWGVTLMYPLIRCYIGVNESHTGILYYVGGYAGYFLLGFYLRNYKKAKAWKCLVLMAIPVIIATTIKLSGVSIDFYDLFGYLSVLVVMMSIAWFMLFKELTSSYKDNSRYHRILVRVSNCCFGIYLIHIFVMRSLLWRWSLLQETNGIVQILLTTVLTFMVSLFVTWIISYMPFAQYIIGYKNKK